MCIGHKEKREVAACNKMLLRVWPAVLTLQVAKPHLVLLLLLLLML
jgi:hypothetical protein